MEIKLYNEDCLWRLKQLEENSIQLIITDSPYNIGFDSSKETHIFEEAWDHKTDEEFQEFNYQWLSECYRILKPSGSLWCFMGPTQIPNFFLSIERTSFINQLKDWKVLYRQSGRGAKHKLKSLSEDILHLTKSDNFLLNSNEEYQRRIVSWGQKLKKPLGWVINYDTSERISYSGYGDIECFTQPYYLSCSQRQIHPCQKSIVLLSKLIMFYSSQGDTVLDCFMGSGSTGVAAYSSNRDFIGIEKDPEMFKKASNWLNKIKKDNSEVEQLIKSEKFRFGIK